MKKTKVWVFRIILISIPILFFVLLELVLRLIGYGASLPLFIETPDSPNYILARPDIVRRYFPTNTKSPNVTMEANLFLKNKPNNGLRLFVQGGSTAAGFPYGLGASPAGMLDRRLKRTFPNKYVEVINTAMSAVNSYTLLDFADEIIEQQPDAVLIYAGHNEYLGILGVGSNYTTTNSHATNLLFLKLRTLRTFQWLQNLYTSLLSDDNTQNRRTKKDIEAQRTLMSKVAKLKTIEKNSDIFKQGLKQFEDNMSLLIDKYLEAKVPVYIATVASNISDHPPFSSHPLSDLQQTQLSEIRMSAQSEKSSKITRSLIDKLMQNETNLNNAEINFQLGKFLQNSGFGGLSLAYFERAKENDLLRFRAPSAINRIIKKLASSKNVHLVDYHENLSKSSTNGLVGNNFMLEHLHPNLQGYFILADSFYQSLKSNSAFGSWDGAIPTSQAWKNRPVIPAEEYYGYSKIMQLMSDYPFTEKPKKVVLPKPADWQQTIGLLRFEKKLDWLGLMTKSYEGYAQKRNFSMLIKTSQIIADALPHDPKANFEFARLLAQEGRSQEAKLYITRALLEQPDNLTYKKFLLSLDR